MAYSSDKPNWHIISNTEAAQLTACTVNPGEVFSYPVSALPIQLQQMPGIYDAYVTRYTSTYIDIKDVAVYGELLAAREEVVGKAYVYFIGVSASEVCFAGPYAPYDGHHYSTAAGVPIEKLFGQSPKPKEQE